MKLFKQKTFHLLAVAAILILALSSAEACTGIMFTLFPKIGVSDNQYAFQARTMEFGPDVTGWRLISVPRGYPYTSCRQNICGDGIEGIKWTSRFHYVGMSPARPGMPLIDEVTDGINERGLACGGFYHMGYEEYKKNPSSGRTIANTDFVSWVLSNFATVKELREALFLRKVEVAQFTVPSCAKAGTCPQLHFAVTDESGASVVIEFKGGEPVVFDSIGVITNNPTYDWHTTNLNNYIGLQALSRETGIFYNRTYTKLGNGTGAIGLPGDFTPPSRFVRAMYFLTTSMPLDAKPDEGVARAFRILNQFDIPVGSIVAPSPTGQGMIQDSTMWTSLSDTKRRRYYFHTQTNRTVRVLELDKLPKNSLSYMELPAHDVIIDVSKKFTPMSN